MCVMNINEDSEWRNSPMNNDNVCVMANDNTILSLCVCGNWMMTDETEKPILIWILVMTIIIN